MVRKKINYVLCYGVSRLTVNFVIITAIIFPMNMGLLVIHILLLLHRMYRNDWIQSAITTSKTQTEVTFLYGMK